MKRDNVALTQGRKLLIAQAFAAWYGSLVERGGIRKRAMDQIGVVQSKSHAFRNGLRTPPPAILAKLYELTKDRVFLYSKEEKIRTVRMNPRTAALFPSASEWPDSDSEITETTVATTDDVAQLVEQIERVVEAVRKFIGNPRAQRRLGKSLLKLHIVLLEINPDVPREFITMLEGYDWFQRAMTPNRK